MIEIEQLPLWPGHAVVKRMSKPQRAALGELLLDPLRAESRRMKSERLTAIKNGYDYVPPASGRKIWDEVAEKVLVSSTLIGRAGTVRKADPRVFARMQRGDFETVEEAIRAAGLTSQKGQARTTDEKINRHSFVKKLKPLRRYLSEWTPGSFNGMTPSEARRLLPQVRATHYALIEVERALEERATVSRALS